jgi:hypothetical protein
MDWFCSDAFLFFFRGLAQQWLTGRIYKINNPEIIPGINIRNLTLNKYSRSDQGGNYKISAEEGNRIIFSSAGYLSDTITVHLANLRGPLPVYLHPNILVLEDVEVDQMNKYVQDSLKRREDYATLLNKKHPVKFMNEKRPGDPPGFSLPEGQSVTTLNALCTTPFCRLLGGEPQIGLLP